MCVDFTQPVFIPVDEGQHGAAFVFFSPCVNSFNQPVVWTVICAFVLSFVVNQIIFPGQNKTFPLRSRKWTVMPKPGLTQFPCVHDSCFSWICHATSSVQVVWNWCWRLYVYATLNPCTSGLTPKGVWMCHKGPWQNVVSWLIAQAVLRHGLYVKRWSKFLFYFIFRI